MPSGFQVFYPNGAVKVDSNTRLSRVIETIYVSNEMNGSYYNERLLSGTPFAVFCPTGSFHGAMYVFSGATFNWRKNDGRVTGYFVIGVY